MIPKILFRTVSAETTNQQEEWWEKSKAMTPGWDHITYRDGQVDMDFRLWPHTGHLWSKCLSGAHMADLIRLEAMWRHGGVYIDSDVEVLQPLENLLSSAAFAAWEDKVNIPNAIFGAEARHVVVGDMLELATSEAWFAKGVWWSGPGLFNHFLKEDPQDWLLLPPGSLYPYHYSEKRDFNAITPRGKRNLEERLKDSPWAFFVHHWNHSWKGTNK